MEWNKPTSLKGVQFLGNPFRKKAISSKTKPVKYWQIAGYPRPPKNEKILGNIIVILFWFIVIFLTLYGLGGMPLVLNGVGLVIGVPILGLFLWIIYKIGNRFHWWLDS